MTRQLHQAAQALRNALEAAGLNPVGLDLDELALIRLETEERIARHRTDPEFGCAKPVFVPPGSPTDPGGVG